MEESHNSSSFFDVDTTTSTDDGISVWGNETAYQNGEEFDPTVMILVCTAVVCLWFLAVLVATKGCTDCSYQDRHIYTGGVWGPSQQERDQRLAEQLDRQQQELQVARQKWRQQALARSQYLETILPKGIVETTNNGNADTDGDISEEPAEWMCAICLSNKVNDTKTIVQSTTNLCHHEFHRSCLASWLIMKTECPVCRQCYLKEDQDEELGACQGYAPAASTAILRNYNLEVTPRVVGMNTTQGTAAPEDVDSPSVASPQS